MSIGCAWTAEALPPVPGVRAIVDTAYYEIDARERRQWMSAMRVGARRAGISPPFVAHTRTQARWRYTGSQSATGGCQARSPAVEVTIHYLMPRLVADTVDEEDMMEWRRYLVSLWRHEEGHAVRALREAA